MTVVILVGFFVRLFLLVGFVCVCVCGTDVRHFCINVLNTHSQSCWTRGGLLNGIINNLDMIYYINN